MPTPKELHFASSLQTTQQQHANLQLSKLKTSQASMCGATKSLNKLKSARAECTGWSLADQKLSSTARGTSKVFPSRVTTADPQAFRGVCVKPNVTSSLRQSLKVEATRLNSSGRQFYDKASADGNRVSVQVQSSMKPSKNNLLSVR